MSGKISFGPPFSSNVSVIAPQLPEDTVTAKEYGLAAPLLLALLDHAGCAKPVVWGRDWGAIAALAFKQKHPKRAEFVVVESSGTLSCFWVSILPTIWPEVIGGFQA